MWGTSFIPVAVIVPGTGTRSALEPSRLRQRKLVKHAKVGFTGIRKSTAWFENPQTLPTFPSDNASTKIEMRNEHECNYPDKQNLKYSERNLSECYIVNNKSHMNWCGIQLGCPRSEAGRTTARTEKSNVFELHLKFQILPHSKHSASSLQRWIC
jgi:hypothetical protein